MTITVYKSSDASAPVLTGQAGAAAGVLDACLVNGYGSKAAAGWGVAFTGTNTRAYRPASGNRLYLSVDDTGTTSCRTSGFEVMTGVLTGTGQFPTAAQVSGGLFTLKSATADATARPWMVIADATFAYVFFFAAQTVLTNTSTNDGMLMFGDLISNASGDAYGTLIMSQAVATVGAGNTSGSVSYAPAFAAAVGHYVPRLYTQTGTAQQVVKVCATRSANSAPGGFGNDTLAPNFPDPVTGGATLEEVFIMENAALPVTRGKIPGLYNLLHNPASLAVAYTNLDTINGTGVYAGNTYTLVNLWAANAKDYAAIQTTGTWA